MKPTILFLFASLAFAQNQPQTPPNPPPVMPAATAAQAYQQILGTIAAAKYYQDQTTTLAAMVAAQKVTLSSQTAQIAALQAQVASLQRGCPQTTTDAAWAIVSAWKPDLAPTLADYLTNYPGFSAFVATGLVAK